MDRRSRLGERLRRMREAAEAAETASKPLTEVDHPSTRTFELPGWESRGDFVWYRSLLLSSPIHENLETDLLVPHDIDLERLLFLDLETTGLSAGAGSVVFLAGLGTVDVEGFRVDQFLLADFPGEPEFLGYIEERLDNDLIYVTYNGKSFDTQMLRTRFIMNGRLIEFPNQLDLLYPARRLWSSLLDSCSLSSIEANVLGVSRHEDVPGSEVPELYFAFLKSGDPSILAPVFAHHLEDVVSLARLLVHIDSILADPSDQMVDRYELGRWLVHEGIRRGEILLREAFGSGSKKAGRLLGSIHKRSGRWEEAVSIWSSLWERDACAHSAVEIAKYLEHKKRSYDEAKEIVESVITVKPWIAGKGSQIKEAALEHRLKRLTRKVTLAKL